MPNTKSAKKALRSSKKKQAFNHARKVAIRNALQDLRKTLATKPKEYQESLSKAYSTLDKAVKTKYLKKGTADRKKSRLAALVARTLGETKAK